MPRNINPIIIQEPSPKLTNICMHAEGRPIGPRQAMLRTIRTRLATRRYCMAVRMVFHDDTKAV